MIGLIYSLCEPQLNYLLRILYSKHSVVLPKSTYIYTNITITIFNSILTLLTILTWKVARSFTPLPVGGSALLCFVACKINITCTSGHIMMHIIRRNAQHKHTIYSQDVIYLYVKCAVCNVCLKYTHYYAHIL